MYPDARIGTVAVIDVLGSTATSVVVPEFEQVTELGDGDGVPPEIVIEVSGDVFCIVQCIGWVTVGRV